MSYPDKSAYSLAAVCCALSLFAKGTQADDSPSRNVILEPRAFEAEIQNGETIGWQQMRRVFVTLGTNEFVFVAPYGLRTDANPDRVALLSADSTYFLSFRILGTAGADPNPGNPDACREFVLDQFPGAKITEEYSKAAAKRNGPAFDLQVKIGESTERVVCVALIPSAAGVLEFTLNADLSKSVDARNALNSMLRTFRSNESGKLEITPCVPDQS